MTDERGHVQGECYEGHLSIPPGVVEAIAELTRKHKTSARVYRTSVLGMYHFAVDFRMYDDPTGRDDTEYRYLLIDHIGKKQVSVVPMWGDDDAEDEA